MRARLTLTLMLCALAPSAHAIGFKLDGRGVLMAGIDTNARRDYDSSLSELDGVGSLVLDGSLLVRGESAQVRVDYTGGVRKFLQYSTEDVLAQAATAEGAWAPVELASFGVNGDVKDRRGGARDYTDLRAFGFVDFFPDERLDLRLRVGGHRFLYRPAFEYSFRALEEGAQLGWRFSRAHGVYAFGEHGERTYNAHRRLPDSTYADDARTDGTLSVGTGYEYRGRFRLRVGYSYFEQASTSFGESTIRHRFEAALGFRLLWSVQLVAEGAVGINRFPDGVFLSPEIILMQDEENANSVSLRLVRPVSERVDAELRYALYQYSLPENGLRYLRQVAFFGLSFRL